MSAGRTLQSDYMYWAKHQPPARFALSSSEVPHVSLDRFVPDIASLELDGASRYRYPPLRQAIAAHIGVDPERVVMADGTSMANMLAMAALLSPGDEVLAETPAYEPMVATARFLGAKVKNFERKVPPRNGEVAARSADGGVEPQAMSSAARPFHHATHGLPPRSGEEFSIDPAAIAAALTPRTRLILLTNLHNPSGALTPPETLLEIAALARSVGARILVDEVYLPSAATPQITAARLGDFPSRLREGSGVGEVSPRPSELPHPPAPSRKREGESTILTTASLTKCYGLSGLRCGWIVADPELAERIWRVNELFGVAQPHAAERLATIAFAHLDAIAAGTAERLAANRALTASFLASRRDLACPPPAHGITCFPRLLTGSVETLHALLRDRYETSIVPGRFFGAPEHFRLGMGGDSAMLEQGLARLGEALDALA